MTKKEINLLQVATALSAKLRAGTPQIMGAEVFDADLLGRLLDHRPNRPIT